MTRPSPPSPHPSPPASHPSSTSFLRISSPEEIKICDPACGSGHMLTYAFDLLYAIYEEQGYQATDIPRLILTNNLYGVEIDPRAGALAAFALTMKAREKYRRFLSNGKAVQPNICVLEKIKVDPQELDDYMDKVGRDLFSNGLEGVVHQWEEADNFGSLIRPLVTDVSDVLELLRERKIGEDLFMANVHQKVLKALRQADYLSPKYHVVVANPPYMNAKGMNPRLKASLADWYPNSKADLMAMFMERTATLTLERAYWAMINIPTWMFLQSFAKLRERLIDTQTIESLLHLGRGIFGSDFGTVAFLVQNACPSRNNPGVYRRLFEDHVDVRSTEVIEELFRKREYNRFIAHQSQFELIPGTPFAYWASTAVFRAFESGSRVSDQAEAFRGISTGDNERFSRFWHEVSQKNFCTTACSPEEARKSRKKWFPYNRGGSYRKWYGLGSEIIDYEDCGARMIAAHENGETPGFRHDGAQGYFYPAITWGALTAGTTSFRKLGCGFVLGHKGPGLRLDETIADSLLCFLNSNAAPSFWTC
ncbi:MAG: BREX-1 system adenine-specific DNA-methyltransferase PglX [Pirellulaceae bacterium]